VVANVKSVEIDGTLPFNCDEHPEMARILAQLNTPTIGLRIKWIGQNGWKPNEHGGVTAMYRFEIRGEEAVSFGYVARVGEIVRACGGVVTHLHAIDLEG
jgi:hypothetical protein